MHCASMLRRYKTIGFNVRSEICKMFCCLLCLAEMQSNQTLSSPRLLLENPVQKYHRQHWRRRGNLGAVQHPLKTCLILCQGYGHNFHFGYTRTRWFIKVDMCCRAEFNHCGSFKSIGSYRGRNKSTEREGGGKLYNSVMMNPTL